MLTQERLKELVSYNPKTGEFFNKTTRSHNCKRGDKSGWLHASIGYMHIRLENKQYKAHRLVFLYMDGFLPPAEVDHVNGIRSDNRYKNLRCVSHAENQKNTRISTRNKSGFNGISWHKKAAKWRAYITIDQQQKHLGLFSNLTEAINCRKDANIEYGFHYNHGSKNA